MIHNSRYISSAIYAIKYICGENKLNCKLMKRRGWNAWINGITIYVITKERHEIKHWIICLIHYLHSSFWQSLKHDDMPVSISFQGYGVRLNGNDLENFKTRENFTQHLFFPTGADIFSKYFNFCLGLNRLLSEAST